MKNKSFCSVMCGLTNYSAYLISKIVIFRQCLYTFFSSFGIPEGIYNEFKNFKRI